MNVVQVELVSIETGPEKAGTNIFGDIDGKHGNKDGLISKDEVLRWHAYQEQDAKDLKKSHGLEQVLRLSRWKCLSDLSL
jgi:hypothetical protein